MSGMSVIVAGRAEGIVNRFLMVVERLISLMWLDFSFSVPVFQ